jgi:uncharacterized membrane protein
VNRRRAVDALRGLVILVMALDHLRDFLGNAHFDATDLAVTTPAIFASRWITHFCAPTFFLLAGTSAYLSIRGGRRTVGEAARFLAVRGLVLVVVEQTALRCLGWYFHFDYHFMNGGVLFGLGWSMVIMAAFVFLPPYASLAAGLAIILGETAIAGLDLGTLWALATKSQDFEPVAGYHFYVSYPPIPWFGAMALGYGIGHLAYREERARLAPLIGLGAGFLALFAVARALSLGEPAWSGGVLGFVNVSKYPPSTPYLLLTLGVALLALAGFERVTRTHVLETYGRVPLFFYLLHIPAIHAIAVVYSLAAFGDASWLTSGPVIFWDTPLPGSPPDYGLSLPVVYLVWFGFAVAMYPLCKMWARVGARRV